MMNRRVLTIALASLVVPLVLLAARTIYVLDGLTPEVQKKPVQGYSTEGSSFHYRDGRIAVTATPLFANDLDGFYAQHGLTNPFAHFPVEANYVFFKIRIENLQKTDNVEFSPGSVMFGNSNALDDIAVYQLFYKEDKGEALLAAAGKTLFLRNLRLPAGQWIERLMVFQYDDPYKTKKIPLIMSNILMGREGLDVEFPFLTHFRKEKVA
jgi:hypothetical protein